MASSSSSSDYYDTKDAISESSSYDSISVEYFTCEDTFPHEDTTSWEDMTSSEGSLLHFLPPIKGTGGMQSESTPIIRQYKIQDEPKQDPKVRISLAWDDEDTESAAHIVERLLKMLHTCLEKLKDGDGSTKDGDKNQKHEKEFKKNDKDKVSAFSETVEGEKFQLCNHSPPHKAQVSHRERDNCQELPKCKLPENEDVIQFPGVHLMFKEQDPAETMSQVTDSQKISTTETTWLSSVETEEEDTPSDTQTTPCLNLRRAISRMRKQVLCCLRRRRNPEQATPRPHSSEPYEPLDSSHGTIMCAELLGLEHMAVWTSHSGS
ncbi:uncharacterized protein C12orf71-like [Erethizon dorsatum]